MIKREDFPFIPILLAGYKQNLPHGQRGTGFIFAHNNKVYLITCYHIARSVAEEMSPADIQNSGGGKINFTPDEFRTRLHLKGGSALSTEEARYVLTDRTGKTLYLTHPNGGPKHHDIDIIALPLHPEAPKKYRLPYFTKDSLFNEELTSVKPLDETVTLGFPYGFYRTPDNLGFSLPGRILNYCEKIEPGNYYLIDARSTEGCSGSPTLIKTKDGWKLLAIHTREDKRAGFSYDLPAKYILEIIENH